MPLFMWNMRTSFSSILQILYWGLWSYNCQEPIRYTIWVSRYSDSNWRLRKIDISSSNKCSGNNHTDLIDPANPADKKLAPLLYRILNAKLKPASIFVDKLDKPSWIYLECFPISESLQHYNSRHKIKQLANKIVLIFLCEWDVCATWLGKITCSSW